VFPQILSQRKINEEIMNKVLNLLLLLGTVISLNKGRYEALNQ